MLSKLLFVRILSISLCFAGSVYPIMAQSHNWKPAMQGVKELTRPTNLPPRIITHGPQGKTWFVGSFLDEDSLYRCAAYWENEEWHPFPVTFDRNSYGLSMAQYGDTIILAGDFRLHTLQGDSSLFNKISTWIKMHNDSVWADTVNLYYSSKEIIVSGDSLFSTCYFLSPTDTIEALVLSPDKGATWRYPFTPMHPTLDPNYFGINIKLGLHKGSMYVTNNIDSLGSPFKGIARYDGQQWHSIGQGVPGFNSKVWDFAFYQDDLYIGGNFNNNIYPNDPGESFARWNEDTQQWEDVGGGVRTIVARFFNHDSLLYAMSYDSLFGDAQIPYMAAWDGHKWCGTPSKFWRGPFDYGFAKDTLLAVFNQFALIDGDTLPPLVYYDGDYVNGPDAICSTPGLGKEEAPRLAKVFSLYPNPNQGSFTLEATAGESIEVVAVYNTQGQLVWQKDFGERLPKVAIDLWGSPPGLYLVKVNMQHAQQIIIK